MNALKIGNHNFTFPQSWKEVTRKQYKNIAPWIMIDTSANRTIVMMSLVQEKPKELKKALENVIKTHDHESNVAWQILRLMDFAYYTRKVDPTSKIQELREVAPIIPDFKYKGVTYLLPKHNLFDTTINEWTYINAYLKGFLNNKPENIIKLVATICRPSKGKKEMNSEEFDGFPRITFNPETIDRRAEKLENVPMYVKHAVLDYVLRSGEFLKKRYGVMFKGQSSDGNSYGWEGSITQLAESGVFGTEVQVRNTLIHKCCRYISQKIIEAKKRKEKDK